ncbi:hypothetical protein [Paraburkholderia translucens]|nr:hypothetical protein [Paraburkholderia sp. MMS20-SJTN17]
MRGKQLQHRALFHRDLAAEPVDRLNAVRAFVNHVQGIVAIELLDPDSRV